MVKTKKKSFLNRVLRNIFWFFYYGVIITIIFENTYSFFSSESALPLFYKMLFYFYPETLSIYIFDFYQTILTALHVIPLTFYIFKIHFLPKYFWKALFIAKILFDCLGYNYAKIQLKTFYADTPVYFWIIIVSMLILYLPFYYAIFHYAFIRLEEKE